MVGYQKRLLLNSAIILFFTLPLFAVAQEHIIKEQIGSHLSRPVNIISLGDGYLIVSYIWDTIPPYSGPAYTKFSIEGSVINTTIVKDSIYYPIPEFEDIIEMNGEYLQLCKNLNTLDYTVYKFNSDANILGMYNLTLDFTGIEIESLIRGILNKINGHFYLSFSVKEMDQYPTRSFLVKYTSDLEYIWHKEIPSTGWFETIYDSHYEANQLYLFTSSMLTSGGLTWDVDLRMLELDTNGAIQMDIRDIGPEMYWPAEDTYKHGDHFLVSSPTMTRIYITNDYFVTRFTNTVLLYDGEWNFEKNTRIGNLEDSTHLSVIWDMVPANNGDGYLLVGRTNHYPNGRQNNNQGVGFVGKISNEGDSLWCNFYKYVSDDTLHSESSTISQNYCESGYVIGGQYTIYNIVEDSVIGFTEPMFFLEIDEQGRPMPNCTLTGSENVKPLNDESIKIFPNPAANQFTIDMSNIQKGSTLKVYDMSGRTVVTENINYNNILLIVDSRNWNPGMYFISVTSKGHQIYSNQVIIQ